MEMNRYLIAALYVMAGCVVAVPLKVQGSSESLNGERCRLVITNTVKVVSTYLDNKSAEQTSGDLFHTCFYVPESNTCRVDFFFDRTVSVRRGALCHTSHKIRAPGL